MLERGLLAHEGARPTKGDELGEATCSLGERAFNAVQIVQVQGVHSLLVIQGGLSSKLV